MTDEEKRAYSRGYNAGRKRNEQEQQRWDAVHRSISNANEKLRHDAFCSALGALIQSPRNWTMDGKAVSDLDQYVELAARFANRARARMGA